MESVKIVREFSARDLLRNHEPELCTIGKVVNTHKKILHRYRSHMVAPTEF